MDNDTEAAIRRVMTPLIGWPRIDAWLREVRAAAWDEGAKAMEQHWAYGNDEPSNPYRAGGAS